jgi:hypothetical protein
MERLERLAATRQPVMTAPQKDRHKHPPIGFRPQESDRRWLLQHAAETGKPLGALLGEALAAYRKRVEAKARRQGASR